MKYKFLFISFFGLTSVFAQKSILSTAKTTNATIYLNGAELTHTSTVNLQKGTNEVIVKNIANQLDENSIRVSSNKAITIMSASFTNRFFTEVETDPNSVAFKKVQDSITLMKRELNVLRNNIEADQQTIQMLDKNQQIGGEDKGLAVVELTKAVDYYRQKRLEIANDIYVLQEKQQKYQSILNRLQTQLTVSESSEDKISNGKIVLQIMSDVAQSAALDISYITNLANWSPFYEIDAKGINVPMHLSTKGKIVQNTGIDWKQVKLSLSSSQPNPRNEIPYLSQWYLSFNQPVSKAYSSPQMLNRNVSASRVESYDEVQVTSMKKEKTTADFTMVKEQLLSVNFDIAILYDILSNGKPHTVNLSEQDIPAMFSYYTAPKVNKDAFLIAQIPDYSQYNLLAGEANILFEGVYVGKTILNPSTTKDTLEVALGVDKNVVVKRDKVAEKSGNKVLSSQKESVFTYDISIRNNKKATIKIVVKDQIPLSNDKDVVVELTDTDRAKLNSEVGTLTWEIDVKPQETKKVRFGYKVKYPKDRTIYNL